MPTCKLLLEHKQADIKLNEVKITSEGRRMITIDLAGKNNFETIDWWLSL